MNRVIRNQDGIPMSGIVPQWTPETIRTALIASLVIVGGVLVFRKVKRKRGRNR